jgi:hypothetical protein
MIVRDIASCRSGDKGDVSNVVVVALRPEDYPVLLERLTVDRVREHFAPLVHGEIVRYEMPGIGAVNFVMQQALAGGVSRSLAIDPHGKSRASLMAAIDLG